MVFENSTFSIESLFENVGDEFIRIQILFPANIQHHSLDQYQNILFLHLCLLSLCSSNFSMHNLNLKPLMLVKICNVTVLLNFCIDLYFFPKRRCEFPLSRPLFLASLSIELFSGLMSIPRSCSIPSTWRKLRG